MLGHKALHLNALSKAVFKKVQHGSIDKEFNDISNTISAVPKIQS